MTATKVLEGSDLYRAIAKAKDAGEAPETFEAIDRHGNIKTTDSWPDLIYMSEEEGYEIQRKPNFRSLVDSRGKEWRWPEPMRVAPVRGTTYKFADIAHKGDNPGEGVWTNSNEDRIRLMYGLIHPNSDNTQYQINALIAACIRETS